MLLQGLYLSKIYRSITTFVTVIWTVSVNNEGKKCNFKKKLLELIYTSSLSYSGFSCYTSEYKLYKVVLVLMKEPE